MNFDELQEEIRRREAELIKEDHKVTEIKEELPEIYVG